MQGSKEIDICGLDTQVGRETAAVTNEDVTRIQSSALKGDKTARTQLIKAY